jgi:hypothetical protein
MVSIHMNLHTKYSSILVHIQNTYISFPQRKYISMPLIILATTNYTKIISGRQGSEVSMSRYELGKDQSTSHLTGAADVRLWASY